jgi:hypothetical protein
MREPFRMSSLKEGTCRLFGMNNLKEGAMWDVDPLLGNDHETNN